MRWSINAEQLTCDRCGTMALVHIGAHPPFWREWEAQPECFSWRVYHDGSWHACRDCVGFEHVSMEPVPGWARKEVEA